MSVEPVSAEGLHDEGDVTCWCCGTVDAASRMVHLGDHPEVHLCLGCAHFVHRQAWEVEDEGRRGPVVLVRHRLRSMRGEVMRRGWHRSKVIGGALRWLDKYVP